MALGQVIEEIRESVKEHDRQIDGLIRAFQAEQETIRALSSTLATLAEKRCCPRPPDPGPHQGVAGLLEKTASAIGAPPLDVLHQRHEAVVHVHLLMTMEQREAGIIGDHVDFHLALHGDHDNVFENT